MTILDKKMAQELLNNGIKERFDAFVKKYNDAVEIYNSKRRTILDSDSSLQLGNEEKPLIEGTYSFNKDGTIDISDRAWKVICLNKIVQVGGCFSFFKIRSTDPQTAEIKEKVQAKEYDFNEDLGENVY